MAVADKRKPAPEEAPRDRAEDEPAQAPRDRAECPVCGDRNGPCCNAECRGEWGTGCYHCHHPGFPVPKVHDVTSRTPTVVRTQSANVHFDEDAPRGELGCLYFLAALAVALGGPYLVLLLLILILENC